MLILAGVSLNAIVGDNGIITNAQVTSAMSRFATYNEELGMNALYDTGIYASGNKLKTYIPRIDEKDIDKFVIMKSKLLYIATNDVEMQAAQKLGLGGISGELSDSGAAIKEIQNIISGVIELKNVFADKVPSDDSQLLDESEHTNTADGLIGTRLFDRNSLNMANHTWNILDEYNSNNEKTARYGTGYYWLKKGVTYIIDGESIEFKNNYVVYYSKNEFTVLSERAVNWSENSTLAVKDNIALNVDPMSLADGEWVNSTSTVYDSTKTFEYELALANAIIDDEAKETELNKVRNENFYNFWIQNPITEEWTNTGTQKTGDVEYDSENNLLKFNENSENNPNGLGGYLKTTGKNVDFSEGFTFEIYLNLDRVGHSFGNGDVISNGYFCRRRSISTSDVNDCKNSLRIGLVPNFKLIGKVAYNSSWTGKGENLSTGVYGASGNWSIDDPGYEVGENVYITFSYIPYYENKDNGMYDDYMRENEVDKCLYFVNGVLKGYTYNRT